MQLSRADATISVRLNLQVHTRMWNSSAGQGEMTHEMHEMNGSTRWTYKDLAQLKVSDRKRWEDEAEGAQCTYVHSKILSTTSAAKAKQKSYRLARRISLNISCSLNRSGGFFAACTHTHTHADVTCTSEEQSAYKE